MDILQEITQAVNDVIAQARSFVAPCVLIVVVTMGVILYWDMLRALWQSFGGKKSGPRGPRHHHVW